MDPILEKYGNKVFGKFNCPNCGIEFTKRMNVYRSNQIEQGKSGPYCSRSCAGTYMQKLKGTIK